MKQNNIKEIETSKDKDLTRKLEAWGKEVRKDLEQIRKQSKDANKLG